MGTRCADHVTPLCPQKLALTSPTGGGRSVGIARSLTKAAEFLYPIYSHNWRNIGTIYITRLASNEIFSPSNKIHREVGRAKDLSAPLYDVLWMWRRSFFAVQVAACNEMFCLELTSRSGTSCLQHVRPSESSNSCLSQKLKQLQLLEADCVDKALNLISLSTISEWITTRLTRHWQYVLQRACNKITCLFFLSLPILSLLLTCLSTSFHAVYLLVTKQTTNRSIT